MAVGGTGFLWEPGVLDSIDPAELESPDPDVAPAHAPVSASDALACAGSDDVRCQPLDHHDSPSVPDVARAGADAAPVSPVTLPSDAARVRDAAFGRTALLGAGRDPSSELLRPPRA